MLKRSSIIPNLLWYIKWLSSINLKLVDIIQRLCGFGNDLKTPVRQGQLSIIVFDFSFVLSPRIVNFYLEIGPPDITTTFPSLSHGHVTINIYLWSYNYILTNRIYTFKECAWTFMRKACPSSSLLSSC